MAAPAAAVTSDVERVAAFVRDVLQLELEPWQRQALAGVLAAARRATAERDGGPIVLVGGPRHGLRLEVPATIMRWGTLEVPHAEPAALDDYQRGRTFYGPTFTRYFYRWDGFERDARGSAVFRVAP